MTNTAHSKAPTGTPGRCLGGCRLLRNVCGHPHRINSLLGWDFLSTKFTLKLRHLRCFNQTDAPLSLNSLGLHIADREKTQREKEVSEHGLGVVTAAIFLAGEMAGSGVLALPFAMKGTST